MATIAQLDVLLKMGTAEFDGPATKAAGSLRRLKSEALSLFKETRTPAEQYEYHLQRVQKLYGRDLISLDTYRRSVQKLTKEYHEAGKAAGGAHGGKGGFWSVPRGLPGTGALRHFGHMGGAAAGAFVAIEAATALGKAMEDTDQWVIKVAADTGKIPGGIDQGLHALKALGSELKELTIIKIPMQVGAQLRYAVDPWARAAHIKEEAETARQEAEQQKTAAKMQRQLKLMEEMKGAKIERTTGDSQVDSEDKRHEAMLRKIGTQQTANGAQITKEMREREQVLHVQNLQVIKENERFEKQKQLTAELASEKSRLKAEIAAVGQDPGESKLQQLKEKGASEAQIAELRAMDHVLAARKEEEKQIEKNKEALKDQVKAQQDVREEILHILNPEEGDYAKTLRKTGNADLSERYAAAKHFEKLRSEAQSLQKDLETPQERMLAREKQLREMKQAGLIDDKQMNRAMSMERGRLGGGGAKEGRGMEFTRGAMDLTAMAGNSAGDPNLQETRRTNQLLTRLLAAATRTANQGKGLMN